MLFRSGLFCAPVRIWMKARFDLARCWMANHPQAGLYGGPSMGAQRASWTAALALEHGGTQGKQSAMALLDLTKAFELVPHYVLIRAARALGYPLWLLRLSLAAYRMTRRIGVSGVYSRACHATRGITAGSGFACRASNSAVQLHRIHLLVLCHTSA